MHIFWSPLSGLKGVKPPVEFGEKTRDCSPGHAGNEGLHIAMTGASRAFSRGVVPGTSVFPWSETGILGNFWGRNKGAKQHFELYDETWDFS